MLESEYKVILENLHNINQSTQELFYLLDDLLSRNTKNYSISFGDKQFEFYPATDKQDEDDLACKRLEIIKLLLQDSFKVYLDRMPLSFDDLPKIFERLFVFTYGADPKEFQMEKSFRQDAIKVSNDGSVRSIPLDMDSVYVQNDLKGKHVLED
jgi:hypothetical protein